MNIIPRAILAFCLINLFSCSYVNRKLGLQDDNLMEEVLEMAIEKYTGLDIDLTPQSFE